LGGIQVYGYVHNTNGWIDEFGLAGCSPSIQNQRRKAVKKAWKQEQDLVNKTGRGTRNWTKPELQELKTTGKVKGYEGHHINNVANNPKLAGNPDNIKFVKGRKEHLDEHGGSFQNSTSGPLIQRNKIINEYGSENN
jgi:hypothetical protein